MESEANGGLTLARLSRGWESLLQVQNMSAESAYRISRLINRALPLAGKIFLKTITGREMLLECAVQTRLVQDQLESQGERLYETLTQLEKTYEDLLKKAYEFRVKAG